MRTNKNIISQYFAKILLKKFVVIPLFLKELITLWGKL